ncbi:hypothetical protein CK203_027385 [Vitis vinifera]|uniref:DUF4283 domain-containing protein n=1 Tax=Vitis vinifera TaxID=29760 RepID=A0A438J9S1_VITVI|nr:hypothetical protein CK203_027385 [Vitis vinifera]
MGKYRSVASSCDWRNGAKGRDFDGGREGERGAWRMEELQWARIRVRIKGEKIPNMMDIWVENMCYSLALWWETRLMLRALPTDERGKPFVTAGEVEGEVQPREGKRVMEAEGGPRLEDQAQLVDGTRRLISGSGRPMDCFRGLDGSHLGPQGVVRMQGRPLEMGLLEKPRGPMGLNPSSSSVDSFGPKEMDGLRRLSEVEFLHKERSKIDLALVEEALRYDSVSSQFGCLEREEGENPLQILIGTEPPMGETVECWDLVEVNKSRTEAVGKEKGSDQIVPRVTKAGGELNWEKSDLAKFSNFLGFSTEGLEKDIMDFLVKIRKRRERVHSKTLLEKSKFERELKRLECSINYEGGKKQNGGEQVRGWSNWVALDALGSAGGMLVCWDKRSLEVMETERLFVGRARGDQRLVGRSVVFRGDFNVILSQRERSRQGWLTGAMRSFAQTVDELELLDLPMQGGVFTWSGGRNNQFWARLDRGPTLFRFENMWLKVDGFNGLLRGWRQGIEEGVWKAGSQQKFCSQQLEYWDGVESERSLSIDETEQKKEVKYAFYKWVLMEEVHWRQKSRELCVTGCFK